MGRNLVASLLQDDREAKAKPAQAQYGHRLFLFAPAAASHIRSLFDW